MPNMKNLRVKSAVWLLGLAWSLMAPSSGRAIDVLQNDELSLAFERTTAALQTIENKRAGEAYRFDGDEFAVTFDTETVRTRDMTAAEPVFTASEACFRFTHPLLTIELRYVLLPGQHFAERRMALTFAKDMALRHVTLGTPTCSTPDVAMVCYRHPDFDLLTAYVKAKHGFELRRPANSEPSRTFFGRTDKGGFFTGIAMPYDDSTLDQQTMRLGFAPNLKVAAGERFECEPVYLGVYRRSTQDANAASLNTLDSFIARVNGKGGFNGAAAAGLTGQPEKHNGPPTQSRVLPLPSEAAAMVAMASTILGPPRHGVRAFACGWHSQFQQADYASDDDLAGDLQSLEFLKACGLDGVTDSHPWGGETAQMRDLRDNDHYTLGPRVRRFVERARELGLMVTQWPTMNNTHPWRPYGGPFRLDRPEWLRGVNGEALGGANADNFERRQANCVACSPFADWLQRIIIDDALGTNLYDSWCMDGDFWGTGAFFHTTIPVTCLADNHDHLPGDANYACQRMLARLMTEVRRRHPNIYVIMCRPLQDLGVWAQQNVDACFTLVESGTDGSNIVGGDEIRTASRIRVHHQFFPHWLDQSLLFPSYADPNHSPVWPSAKLDYILISAISSSPNLLMYLPTKTGIPDADKAEIRKWLDWGRQNVAYLKVRKDLPDWPSPGKVDGSAHIIGQRGFVFLFNPSKDTLPGEFVLTEDSIGLVGNGTYRISLQYPAAERVIVAQHGETVEWDVPGETAVILEIQPGQ